MKRKLHFGVFAALVIAAGGWAVAMLVPWSEPCAEQRAAAVTAWRRYAQTAPSAEREGASQVATAALHDLPDALSRADRLTPPTPVSGSYRDAMERLALAQSACGP